MNPHRLLERFLKYVQIDTTAGEPNRGYPSSAGQLELGRLLVEELRAIGLTDAHQDANGLVWGTIPATVAHSVPVIAFNAHLDTSPETTGRGVRPQVVHNYSGGDLVLPGDSRQVIRVAESPELDRLHGCTLITTDGTTLLGADDKAGIAVIMELAAHLFENQHLPHGPIRVLFTCDEEIGHGVDHVDLAVLGAAVCYTLDGQGADEIDVETFSADLATVTIRGVNIHPAIAKGRMVNAIRAAAEFVGLLPRDSLSPETTDGRQGFLHPYHWEGGVAEVRLKVLLRDFATAALSAHADRLRHLATEVEARIPGVTISVAVETQYRNLGDGLAREPRAVAHAEEAHRRLGRSPRRTIVRGGTDGSRLTERGLPTPNLSTGQHNLHSPLEWACLEEMTQAAEVICELVQVWAEHAAQTR